MVSSTVMMTPDEITRCLELEAQEARHQVSNKDGEKLLTAKQKKPKGQCSSMKCSNCLCSGHTVKKYWKEGGGSVNQAPEWWKSAKDKRDDKGKQKKKSQVHAAITEDSTDSGSQSCSLLHEDPKCSID